MPVLVPKKKPVKKSKQKPIPVSGSGVSPPIDLLPGYTFVPSSIELPEEPSYVGWATRNAVYYETQDSDWTVPYEIRLELDEDPYEILADVYSLLRLDLQANTFVIEDYEQPAVLIQELNFDTLTLEVEGMGYGQDIDEAKSQAAEEALRRIFNRFRE